MTDMPRPSTSQRVVAAATPWTLYVVGLSTFGVSLYLIVAEPSTDKWHVAKHGGLMAVSLLVLPGVWKAIATNAASALQLYRDWKSAGKAQP